MCAKCGQIRTGLGKGLTKICGDNKISKARLTRLRQGYHPYDGRSFTKVARLTAGWLSGEQWQHGPVIGHCLDAVPGQNEGQVVTENEVGQGQNLAAQGEPGQEDYEEEEELLWSPTML